MFGVWRKLGFSLGSAGLGVGAAPISLLLLFYLTETLGVRPALAGLVVALPKVWDVVVDPAMGGLVDQAAHRVGRRSPIIAGAAAAYCAAVYLLFSLPPLASAWLVLGLAVGAMILSSVAHTAVAVSTLALVDDMVEAPAGRSSLLAFSGVVAALVTLGATALTPLLVSWTGGGRTGYSRMAATIALASGAMFAVFVLAVRRYPTRQTRAQSRNLAWAQYLKVTFHNRTFYRLVLFLVSFGVSAGLIGAFVPYINRYILHGGPPGLAVLASLVLVSTVAAMPLAAMLVRRFGEVAVLRLGNGVMLCSYPLIFAASFGPIWATWLAVAGFGLGVGGLAVVLQSMTMDVAKAVLPGGVVVPLGFYLGIFVSGQKLGQSLGTLLAGGVLEVIHLVPGAPAQPSQVLWGLRLGYTVLPFVLGLLGATALIGVGRSTARPAAAGAQG
ncbi:MAG: MFS transporter [Caulobacteraceae bacterium]|nr:MFS transporter [Caulobacteraceae bacterium]